MEFRDPSWLGVNYAILPNEYSQPKNRDLYSKVAGELSPAQYPHNYVQLEEPNLSIKINAQELKFLDSFNKKEDINKILRFAFEVQHHALEIIPDSDF